MKRVAAAVLVLALLAGCGGGKASGKQVPPPSPPSPPSPLAQPASPSTQVAPSPQGSPPPSAQLPDDIRSLKLAELRSGLEAYLNVAPSLPARERLAAQLERWGIAARQWEGVNTIPMAETDLDGNGLPELVTALNTWGDWQSIPAGAIFVISRSSGTYRVDEGNPPPESYIDGVHLVRADTDLTGDGRPEILWVALTHGAHTGFMRVLVSTWQPGKLETLPGDMVTSNARLELDGRDILLTGGTVSSAGAGITQREATWRYRWVNGSFTMVDRRFAPSDYGYHRLLDGINAEVFGRDDEARAFFRSVLEPGRVVLPPEHLKPGWEGRFGPAVVEFARFRLGLSLLRAGETAAARDVAAQAFGPYAGLSRTLSSAPDTDKACRAALAWGAEHPAFAEELNAPFGYNSVRWSEVDLCARVLPEPQR